MLFLIISHWNLCAQSTGRTNVKQKTPITENNRYAKLFNSKLDFETESFPIALIVSDLDGDDKNDIVVANFGRNSLSIFRNANTKKGVLNFDSKFEIEAGLQPYHIAIGDLDGDGRQDLVVANRGNNTISAFLNTTNQIGSITFAASVEKITGDLPRSVSIGDLDGDNKPEIAVANAGDGTVSLYRNTSTGAGNISFNNKIDLTGSSPYFVSIRDLDHDGLADLSIANSSLTDNTISILKNISNNIGELMFDDQLDYETGLKPWSVSIGDFDGDHNLDLAVANLSNSSVSVFKNTNITPGVLSFTEKIDFTVGQDPHSIFIGDLNNDGLADMAVTNAASNSISVLRNTSNGVGNIMFNTHEIYETGTQPFAISGGDLNGDGKSELVVLNLESYTLSILHNQTEVLLTFKEFEALRIYPNPISDRVNIEGIKEPYLTKILSLSGEIVYSGMNEATIDMVGFHNGIYCLKIICEKGEVKVRKLIKK